MGCSTCVVGPHVSEADYLCELMGLCLATAGGGPLNKKERKDRQKKRDRIRAKGNSAFNRHCERYSHAANCTDPQLVLRKGLTATQIASDHFDTMARLLVQRAWKAGTPQPSAGDLVKGYGWGLWLDMSTGSGGGPPTWAELSSVPPPRPIATPDAGDVYLFFRLNKFGLGSSDVIPVPLFFALLSMEDTFTQQAGTA